CGMTLRLSSLGFVPSKPFRDSLKLVSLRRVRRDEIDQQALRRVVIEPRWVWPEAFAIRMPWRVQGHRVTDDDVIGAVLHPHRYEAFAVALHVSEEDTVHVLRPLVDLPDASGLTHVLTDSGPQ